MKALAISEDRRSLEELQRLTQGLQPVNEMATHEGSLEGLTALPVRGAVDILMLDCRHGGVAQLAALERMAGLYPALNTILIVDVESPEMLLRALRIGVREVIKTPLNRDEIQSALNHILRKTRNGSQGQGRVLSFVSCKGGSGATFLATNLAYALAAQSDERVLLIDLNLQFGDAVLYVSDRRPVTTVIDITSEIQQVDMALLSSATIQVLPNYLVLAAPEDPTHAIDVRPNQIEALIRFARSNFDHVVLDVGRSLDTCSIQALDLSDHVYPVLQLTLPFLRDAKRLFDVFRSLDYAADKVRPIVNRVERASDLSPQDAARHLVYKVFATVPNHYRSVTSSVNQGVPIIKLSTGSPVAKSIEELAARIAPRPDIRPRGLRARLFGR